MRKHLGRLAKRMQLWLQRTSEVARFDGIIIADLRDLSPHFRETIVAALQLIKASDPLRYSRVKRHLEWILNCTLPHDGAQYHHDTRTCKIDFEEPGADWDVDLSIGWCARILVHEATHGVINSRGISYTTALRERIERLCVTEEQRFLLHLTVTKPDLATDLYREFDAALWESSWSKTPFQKFKSYFRRLFSQ